MPVATPLQGFEERLVEAPDGRLRYFVGGAGPPLVLVHGLSGAASNWTELAALLAPSRRLLVPDLPGHGGSGPPPAGADLTAYADCVARCVEHEKLLPTAVAGHSLGGAVALRLALHRPEAVSALVLAAPAGISSSTLRARAGLTLLGLLRPSRIAARYRNRIAGDARLKRLVFPMLAADPTVLSPEAVHGFLAGSALARDTATAAAALFAEDPRPELDRLRCPVLLLWGARDRFLPLEDGFEYARRLRAPLRVLPDTGHLLIAERPGECAALIGAFLRGVRARPGRAGPAPALHGVREVDELPR